MHGETKQTFYIEVTRTSYAHKTIEVKAKSQEEANALALADAPNHYFKENTSEYEIN